MGNCIYLEQQLGTICYLCKSEIGMKYVYCAYCHKRFHSRCVLHNKTVDRCCPNCKHQYMRFIDRELHRNYI